MIPWISPCLTSTSTLFNAWRAPKFLHKPVILKHIHFPVLGVPVGRRDSGSR
jgi:hypothetical protein